MSTIREPMAGVHQDPVRNIAFTPDSRFLFSADDGGRVLMSTVPDGRRTAGWQCHETAIGALAVRPDEGLLVTAAVDGQVCAWSLDVDRPHALRMRAGRNFPAEVSGAAFRPGVRGVLAIADHTGTVALWTPASDAVHVVGRLPAQVNSASWSPDGRRLAVGCDDCHLYQFDFLHGIRTVFRGHGHHADQLGYSRCGRYLASGSHDHTVRVWDAESGRCLSVLAHPLDTAKPDWSHDGRLVTSSYDQRVRVWRPLTGELVAEIHEHHHDVDDVSWSPDNRWIASCAWDHTARLYSADHYNQVAVIGTTSDRIGAVAVDPERRRCFVGTAAGHLYEVQMLAGATPRLLPDAAHDGAVTSADLSPACDVLATTGTDSRLMLTDVSSSSPRRTVSMPGDGLDLDVVRFSPTGRQFAVGDRCSQLTIHAIDGLAARPTVKVRHERRIKAIAWSSAHGLLASAADGNVRVIDAATGRVLRMWRAHDRMINGLGWSGDGELIATASWDRKVRIFDRGGTLRHELAAHRYNVSSVEFGPFGTIATASWDGEVGIWDATTGRLRALITMPDRSPVQAARWMPGTSALIAVSSAGDILRIAAPDWRVVASWHVPTSAPAEAAASDS